MESLERKKKRYERDLESTINMSKGSPLVRLILSGIFWGLIMGPGLYFIDYYEDGFAFSWPVLLRGMALFFVAGIIFEIIFIWLFYPYLIRRQKKKLAKVEAEIAQSQEPSTQSPPPRT